MGHLGLLFLLFAPLTCCHHILGAVGQPRSACLQLLDFRCSNGSCVPRQRVCDGRADCEDGSDERRCGHLRCKKDEFACHNRLCISPRLRCNGVDDCGDGSDEASCKNCSAPGSFSCGPGEACLPGHKLCDGRADCKDGRDESPRSCGSSRPKPQTSPSACGKSEFRCGDGQCIYQTWTCDHAIDCADGSDEVDCDQNECEVNNGGCSHHCVDQLMGFFCDCPYNMRLVGDSQCEEVDTCLESDVCDQLCVHVNGSLNCYCHEDYQMNLTTRECKAKGDKAQLVFTSSKGIRWISTAGTEYGQPAPQHELGPGPVAALAYDRKLYWARQGRGSIYSVSMDGKLEDSELVLKVQGSVSGLAVDWIHWILFWTSTESSSVNVCLLDGSAQRTLITGLDEPSAVAVDPLQGLLFWAQRGSSPQIERASLDGRHRMALVTSSIRHPVALSLDIPRQLLYWVDQGMRSISRVNLEGHHRKIVVESNGYLDRPFGLALFEGFVYWSEEVTQSICRANKHDGGDLQVLLSNATSPRGLVIMQPVLQPNGPAACGRTGVMCEHECVVDLRSETPEFSCSPPEEREWMGRLPGVPIPTAPVPATNLSDHTFAGILALILFLSVLLVGMALWWWREQFRPSRSLTEQSFSLKESQDPLILQEPHMGPDTCIIEENLLKLNSDGE